MRALETIGVFKQVSPGVFINTPASECLRKSTPDSRSAIVRTILSVGYGQYEAWAGLLGSIQTGKPGFDQIFGCSAWEWYQRDPQIRSVFIETMRSVSAAVTPVVTSSFDWSRFPLIADVGGGIGDEIIDILNSHPSCRGILFDQPEVVAGAGRHERVEPIEGDFFKSAPKDADAYILRRIIHDWADPEAMIILKNVRQAMKPGSRLVLIEEVVPDLPKSTFGLWLDPHMLVMHGGQERTANEYRELLARCGLVLEQIVQTTSPVSLIVGRTRIA
jgi:O-methyltransferase domain